MLFILSRVPLASASKHNAIQSLLRSSGDGHHGLDPLKYDVADPNSNGLLFVDSRLQNLGAHRLKHGDSIQFLGVAGTGVEDH